MVVCLNTNVKKMRARLFFRRECEILDGAMGKKVFQILNNPQKPLLAHRSKNAMWQES